MLHAKLYDDNGNLVQEMPINEKFLWLCELTPRDPLKRHLDKREHTWREWGDCDAQVILQGGYWRPIAASDPATQHKGSKCVDGNWYEWMAYPRRYFGEDWGELRRDKSCGEESTLFRLNPQDLPREFSRLRTQWSYISEQVVTMQQAMLRKKSDPKDVVKPLLAFCKRDSVCHPMLAGLVMLLVEFVKNYEDMAARDRQNSTGRIFASISEVHNFLWNKYEKLVHFILEDRKVKVSELRETKKLVDNMEDAEEYDGVEDEKLLAELKDAGLLE